MKGFLREVKLGLKLTETLQKKISQISARGAYLDALLAKRPITK